MTNKMQCTKFIFGRSFAPDPAEGAHDAAPDPLVGWGGWYPLPTPYPLDAYGFSFSALLAPRPNAMVSVVRRTWRVLGGRQTQLRPRSPKWAREKHQCRLPTLLWLRSLTEVRMLLKLSLSCYLHMFLLHAYRYRLCIIKWITVLCLLP